MGLASHGDFLMGLGSILPHHGLGHLYPNPELNLFQVFLHFPWHVECLIIVTECADVDSVLKYRF